MDTIQADFAGWDVYPRQLLSVRLLTYSLNPTNAPFAAHLGKRPNPMGTARSPVPNHMATRPNHPARGRGTRFPPTQRLGGVNGH